MRNAFRKCKAKEERSFAEVKELRDQEISYTQLSAKFLKIHRLQCKSISVLFFSWQSLKLYKKQLLIITRFPKDYPAVFSLKISATFSGGLDHLVQTVELLM